jgi:hypothetical protein
MNKKLFMIERVLTVVSYKNVQNFGGKLSDKMNAKIQGIEGTNKKHLEEAASDSSNKFFK